LLTFLLKQNILSGPEISVNPNDLLITETTLFPAIRASPCNGVTCHAPQVLLHALGAYLKTTATCPAERHLETTDVADKLLLLSPSGYCAAFYWMSFHLVFLK
jgi:hypothetical protein